MVSSCTKGDVTVNHEPIDFAGQVQKTTATLAGDTGTYDIIETYSFVIPQLGREGKLEPLDELLRGVRRGVQPRRHQREHERRHDLRRQALRPPDAGADATSWPTARTSSTSSGLSRPTTFAEMKTPRRRSRTKARSSTRSPCRCSPAPTSSRRTTQPSARSGVDLVDADAEDREPRHARVDTGARGADLPQALHGPAGDDLRPAGRPAADVQRLRGDAIMFSGRMNDLTLESNSQFAKDMAFAAPAVGRRRHALQHRLGGRLVDSQRTPKNDKDMLFEMIASSVSEKASKASLPRRTRRETAWSPSRAALRRSRQRVDRQRRRRRSPTRGPPMISNAITPIVANVVVGKTTVDGGHRADAGSRARRSMA